MAKKLTFPKGFYWGAATSAHQVEGGNKNDWSEWEKENAGRLAREAKDYWQPWQQEKFPEMFDPQNYISGRAADHYNRYEEDFDIAKELGMNAQRISLEWSRIEPEEGKFSDKEIEHYRKVIVALRARGIEPFVTLWHTTNPIWIRNRGGWMDKETPRYFARYVKYLVEHLSVNIRYWITINEPSMYAFMSSLGYGPWMDWPYAEGNYGSWLRMSRNLAAAHKEAYYVIKIADENNQVGVAKSRVFFEAYGVNPASRVVTRLADYFHNERFLRDIADHQDFLGINYFTHNRIRVGFGNPRGWFNHNENREVSDFGWELYPEGIYKAVMSASEYSKPIYVTENGIADMDDIKRAEFIKDHLVWLHKAVNDGANVRGYFHWSLLDNFEWTNGFWSRFGLVEIDYKNDLRRKIRGSAKEYAKIIRQNGLER